MSYDPDVIRQGVFGAPGPRERFDTSPITARNPTKPGHDPQAPIIVGKTKHKRAVIKAALETFLLSERCSHGEKTAVRSFLRELHKLERQRPDSTVCSILRLGKGLVSIWAYEADFAPVGRTPQIKLPWSQSFAKALSL